MLYHFYDRDYKDAFDGDMTGRGQQTTPKTNLLFFHTAVYALADKLLLPDLKELVAEEFGVALPQMWNFVILGDLIEQVFLIPAGPPDLQEHIKALCKRHVANVAMSDTFMTSVSRSPELNNFLNEYLAIYEFLRCTRCKKAFFETRRVRWDLLKQYTKQVLLWCPPCRLKGLMEDTKPRQALGRYGNTRMSLSSRCRP